MSEQLDMMSEFCYGPDAFQNSGISHSYVRVSYDLDSRVRQLSQAASEKQRPVLINGHF